MAVHDTAAEIVRRLLDDAGHGEHNVLALIEHYQRSAIDAEERLAAVRSLLEDHGCDCECDCAWESHRDDCDRCLACRIAAAVGGCGT